MNTGDLLTRLNSWKQIFHAPYGFIIVTLSAEAHRIIACLISHFQDNSCISIFTKSHINIWCAFFCFPCTFQFFSGNCSVCIELDFLRFMYFIRYVCAMVYQIESTLNSSSEYPSSFNVSPSVANGAATSHPSFVRNSWCTRGS